MSRRPRKHRRPGNPLFDPRTEARRLQSLLDKFVQAYPPTAGVFQAGFHQQSITTVSLTVSRSFPALSLEERYELAKSRTEDYLLQLLKDLLQPLHPDELLCRLYEFLNQLLIHNQIEYGGLTVNMQRGATALISAARDLQLSPRSVRALQHAIFTPAIVV